jgi:tRNA-dihydrouridine synthase 4
MVFPTYSVTSLSIAEDFVAKTKCDGVMAARGLLDNPAMFAGYESTPLECVEKYIYNAVGYGSTHFIMHHHLMVFSN